MTTATSTPDTFRSAHQLGALASLAHGAGMDLRTVHRLATEDNLVMAVRRYMQQQTEQRWLSGHEAQRIVAQKMERRRLSGSQAQRLLQLLKLREAW